MKPKWKQEIENYDRTVRRSNLNWKANTVRIGVSVALIRSDRVLILSKLNDLPRIRGRNDT